MLRVKSRKWVWVLCCALFCAVTIYYVVLKNTTSLFQVASVSNADSASGITLPATSKNTTKEITQPAMEALEARAMEQHQPASPEEQWPTIMGSPQNAAEIKDWFGSRGHAWGSGANNEYSGYDQQTLEPLVQSGDWRAMLALADIVYGTVGGFDKAKDLYINAAIYGASAAFDNLGLIYETSIYRHAETEEAKRSSALEVLAWYNAATFRGDTFPNAQSAKSFIRMEKINLSPDDIKQIKARSQEIYSDIAQQRKALGLGEFDNSVPQSVKRFFELNYPDIYPATP